MSRVQEFAPAKINLSLKILGKRKDGYHELQTLVTFADVGDILSFDATATFGLHIDGPFAKGLSSESDNLIAKASHAFQSAYPESETGQFTLTKNLPIASGIGGGSADAAAALRCLARANNMLDNPTPELEKIAARLGADVPMCLHAKTLFATGIGEEIHEAGETQKIPAVLVNPNNEISTAQIFKSLAMSVSDTKIENHPPRFSTAEEFIDFVADARNDLQAPAAKLEPSITQMLTSLSKQKGCWATRMSGSGATCFGLFETTEQSQRASEEISKANPGWWVKQTTLG